MSICTLRPRSTVAVIVAMLLTAACATAPDGPPSRAGYPGKQPGDTAAQDSYAAGIDEADDLTTPPRMSDFDAALFEATQSAIAVGDWMGATLALPELERVAEPRDTQGRGGPADETTALWARYFAARIALLRGDIEEYDALLGELDTRSLPPALRNEVLLHRLQRAQLEQNYREQVSLSYGLYRFGAHPEYDRDACLSALWQAALRLPEPERRQLLAGADPELRAWLELSAAAKQAEPRNVARALSVWQQRYPQHPASIHADALSTAAVRDSATAQLTLLLPLSGPLEKAGYAVSRGFIAAFYADRNGELGIDVIDSRRFQTIGDAYRAAATRGADVVVGPLGKREVEELLAQGPLPVPLLTLNRPEVPVSQATDALLLSLAPEDEAMQLAERAYAEGVRRALLVRPEGVWGERMQKALAVRFGELGGRLPSSAVYGKPSTHSDAIRNALSLDESTQRSAAVRALFNSRVETAGRRREDLDAVFLLSQNSEEARALKPMINYHYAGDLPVYALSTADGGSDDPAVNRDLGGVRLLAMPWRLSEDSLPGVERGENPGSFAALHALGADAFAVARRWWQMSSDAHPVYDGLTGTLYSAPDGRGELLRQLNATAFDRGSLTAP